MAALSRRSTPKPGSLSRPLARTGGSIHLPIRIERLVVLAAILDAFIGTRSLSLLRRAAQVTMRHRVTCRHLTFSLASASGPSTAFQWPARKVPTHGLQKQSPPDTVACTTGASSALTRNEA